jgi:hypothetical protein
MDAGSMALTIELPPDIEARYAVQAAAKGVPLNVYLRDRLVEQAPSPSDMTISERLAALQDWMAGHKPTPPLSDEAISRETIYEKRG